MESSVIIGNRRFTCLSPTLVRMEYASDGNFEDRRSLVAYEPRRAQPFVSQTDDGEWAVLKTEALTIRTRRNDRPMGRLNLEVRWVHGGWLQAWRPGDRDHRNLGGTLRSLDRYGRQPEMRGAHVADLDPPDAKGMEWLAWLDCEEDPVYKKESPHPPERGGNRHNMVGLEDPEGILQARSFNATADAHRYSTGVLSRSGYWLLNDSESPVMDDDDFPVERNRPGAQDWYFFGYGHDYRAALRDFRNLCGPAPLPTHNALGLMFSRWPAYPEAEAKEIVADFEKKGYPLSVLVLDMEWHKEGWGHWDWDETFYADPAAFLAYCHGKGIHVTLNDHPLWVRSDDSHFDAFVEAAGIRDKVADRDYNGKTLPMVELDICSKGEAVPFIQICHKPILEQGVDFWWNDGYCGDLPGAIGQLVMNKLCFEDVESVGKRGMLLARYGGLGSHRYGGFFTGDTTICWEVLRMQVEFNIRAAGVGMAWVSHDIGGFCGGGIKDGRIDPETYLRWMQFGVFNPLLRFHSAPDSGSRKPWDYEPEGGESIRHWLRVRNSLLPYLYSAGRETYDSGMPVARGLYLDEPENPAAYRFDQFLFGPSLLVAPVTRPGGEVEFLLPDGLWWEFETSRLHHGGMEIRRRVPLTEIPVYARAGSLIPRQDPDAPLHGGHIQALTLDVYAGADGEAMLYEDDGATADYRKGAFCKTRYRLRRDAGCWTIRGEVAEGTPLGETRQLRLMISMSETLRAAVLPDGTELPVSRDESSGRWRVDLPETSAVEAFELRLLFGSPQ